MSSSFASTAVTTTTGVAEEEGPVLTQQEMTLAFLEKLFDLQEQRAAHIAQSRQLLKDLTETKSWLQKHMARCRVPEIGIEARGRHLKRKMRKVYDRITVDKLLDKIEEQYGVGERRKFDVWIEQSEKTVIREVVEYKITYNKVRKAGEHNAGAMPQRKRARPGGAADAVATTQVSATSTSSSTSSSTAVARTLFSNNNSSNQ